MGFWLRIVKNHSFELVIILELDFLVGHCWDCVVVVDLEPLVVDLVNLVMAVVVLVGLVGLVIAVVILFDHPFFILLIVPYNYSYCSIDWISTS